MNINCSKYLNLLKKDFLISKNMIFLLIYFFVIILGSPLIFENDANGNMLNIIATVTLFEMIAFGSQQVLISEKCKGNELIITTSYTRKDLIYSRYLFFYLLSLVCMAFSFVGVAVLYPSLTMNFFVILEYIFMVCTGSAILVALTFKMKSNLSYTTVAFILAAPILGILFSSHITSDLEGVADNIILINKGKIIFQEMTETLENSYFVVRDNVDVLTDEKENLFLKIKREKGKFKGIYFGDKERLEAEFQSSTIERADIEDIMLANVFRTKNKQRD